MTLIAVFVAGLLAWTFAEYAIHNWYGHLGKGRNEFSREHLALKGEPVGLGARRDWRSPRGQRTHEVPQGRRGGRAQTGRVGARRHRRVIHLWVVS